MLAWGLDIFLNCDKITRLRCPVGIMHGTTDEVVPFGANGEALWKRLRQDPGCQPVIPLWCDGFGHNNMPREACLDYVRELLLTLNPGAQPTPPLLGIQAKRSQGREVEFADALSCEHPGRPQLALAPSPKPGAGPCSSDCGARAGSCAVQ